MLETARLLDALGYDLIGVQDHPYQPRFLDTSSLLAAILAQTATVRVFADVGNLPLRPPAVLAKAAATLDLLSGGRFELGIGAGGYLEAAHAMGAPALTPAQSLEALEEAIAVVRAMWSGERRGLRFDGRYYQLEGVHPGPVPVHPIQVWVGANMPRALALTGRVADGWVSPLMSYKPPREAAQANLAIDRAAREAGPRPARDPPHLQRPGCVHEHEPGPCHRHRPGDRRPARALGRGSDSLRARPRASARSCSSPRPTRRRSPPSSRTSPRGCASAWPSGAPPRPRSPRPRSWASERLLAFEETPETNRGRELYEMLLAVHAQHPQRARRRRTARGGRPRRVVPDGLDQELEALRSNSMLWQFQLGCLRYCRFVHLAPSRGRRGLLRRAEETNPAIGPVVERLRAEHRAVSDYLDAVEAAARALTDDDSLDARRAVADALDALAGHLLAHLEYEEQSVAATARRLRDLPSPIQAPGSPRAQSPTEEDHQ